MAKTTSKVHASPVKLLSSSSNKRINKKRKSIIESDLEDGDEDHQETGTSSKKHKHKQGKYAGNVEDQQSVSEAEVAKVSGYLLFQMFILSNFYI